MNNTFGVQLGFLFAPNSNSTSQANTFALTVAMGVLNFQLGYELGTVGTYQQRHLSRWLTVFRSTIINTNNTGIHHYKNFYMLPNFEDTDLEKSCSLKQLKNAAYAKDFIGQTSIDGISVRRSFDLVDENFCKKYPLVMAQIIIFGSAMDEIDKTHYPKYKLGN